MVDPLVRLFEVGHITMVRVKMNIFLHFFEFHVNMCRIMTDSMVKTIARTNVRKNSYSVFRSFLGLFPKNGPKMAGENRDITPSYYDYHVGLIRTTWEISTYGIVWGNQSIIIGLSNHFHDGTANNFTHFWRGCKKIWKNVHFFTYNAFLTIFKSNSTQLKDRVWLKKIFPYFLHHLIQ